MAIVKKNREEKMGEARIGKQDLETSLRGSVGRKEFQCDTDERLSLY